MKACEVIVEGKNLSVGYEGAQKKIVHERLNFRLYGGELTCLLGANGAGKSTLLRTLAAAQPFLSGGLDLMGRPVGSFSVKERSRLIGIVLTDKTQAGGLTVRELVALGRYPHTGFFGRLDAHDREMVDYALRAVGMTHKADSYVARLSDGERQKTMIAKVLVQECPLILLDEPTAFLDVVSRIEIMSLLRRLAVEERKAVLLSTHDIEQALVLSDRLWLMTDKYGLECGCTEDLILSGRIDTLFESQPHVRFDLMHGGFSPVAEGKRRICLIASDEVLRHWAQNALSRHGYSCINSSQTDSSGCPILKVLSSCRLILFAGGNEIICSSFDALFDALNDWSVTF